MHALQLEWERFASKKHENEAQFHTFRKRVPGGWLVFVKMGDSSGLTFCIDTEHQWTIETSERVEISEE